VDAARTPLIGNGVKMKVRRVSLSIAALAVAMGISVSPTASAAGPPGGPPTTSQTWSVGGGAKSTSGGVVPLAWGVEGCVGQFRTMEVSLNVLHYGGIQQCAPSPADQTLVIDVYEVIGTGDHQSYDYVHQSSTQTVNWTASIQGTHACAGTTNTRYIMAAYGTADGIHSTPWPAWSTVWPLNCAENPW